MNIMRHRMSYGVVLALLLLTGCSRAPSFDIIGSFFPAWLLCLIVSIFLTGITAWVLRRLQLPVALPIVTYSSLTALFTFALWLLFFGW
jgi:hypothetical protein